MISQTFKGKGLERWKDSLKSIKDIYEVDANAYIYTTYTVYTKEGNINIIDPYWEGDSVAFGEYEQKYLRFALDHDDILDIPKENILFVRTKHGRRIDSYETWNELQND